MSVDLFLFLFFFELLVIPLYLLVMIWGFVDKEQGAPKLLLYSAISAIVLLFVTLALYAQTGGVSFDLLELEKLPKPKSFQLWAFPLSCLGFGLLAGLWPLHSWAQPVMKCTPAGINILIAGVIMKLGGYGIYRISIPLFPEGFLAWKDFFAILSLIGIISCALSALVQRDIKSIATSATLSLMGFVILALMVHTPAATLGALLQMFSHGILVGLLWGIVGRMICDRTHATEPDALGFFKLSKTLPFALGAFTVCAVGLAGTPLFSSCMAELHILVGVWEETVPLALVSGVGLILTAIYLSRTIHLIFFARTRFQKDSPTEKIPAFYAPQSITLSEKLGTYLLLALSLLTGIYPQVLLVFISPCVQLLFSELPTP